MAACGNCTVKVRTGPVLSTKFSRRCADLNRLPVYISEVSDGPLTKGVVSVVPDSPSKKQHLISFSGNLNAIQVLKA